MFSQGRSGQVRKFSPPTAIFLMHLLKLINSYYIMYKGSDLSCCIPVCQVGVFLWYRHAHKLLAVVGYEPTPFWTRGLHYHRKRLLPGPLDSQSR